MQRSDVVIKRLVDEGLIDEILEFNSDSDTSKEVIAQFIIDVIEGVTAEVILDELEAYYTLKS
jgi:hypothetical protein